MANARLLRSFSWAAGVLVVAAMGCGRGDPTGEPISEFGLLWSLVDNVGETCGNPSPDEFNKLFVAGSAPAGPQRAKYGRPLYFVLNRDSQVSGDTATLTVDVSRNAPDGGTPTPVGKVKWAAVKEGGVWKLKDAPLP